MDKIKKFLIFIILLSIIAIPNMGGCKCGSCCGGDESSGSAGTSNYYTGSQSVPLPTQEPRFVPKPPDVCNSTQTTCGIGAGGGNCQIGSSTSECGGTVKCKCYEGMQCKCSDVNTISTDFTECKQWTCQ